MALTTQQKISLYEILDTPYDGSVDEMVGRFGLDSIHHSTANTAQQVQVRITDRLSALTAEEETVLLNYIGQWEAIGTQTYALDGGTGAIDGVSYSPNDELERIRERVKNLVPVRWYWEDVRQSQAGKSMTMNSIR